MSNTEERSDLSDEYGRKKRTYLVRKDQINALDMALAKAKAGQESRVHGEDRSRILERLLDLHGYNAHYLSGEGDLQ